MLEVLFDENGKLKESVAEALQFSLQNKRKLEPHELKVAGCFASVAFKGNSHADSNLVPFVKLSLFKHHQPIVIACVPGEYKSTSTNVQTTARGQC